MKESMPIPALIKQKINNHSLLIISIIGFLVGILFGVPQIQRIIINVVEAILNRQLRDVNKWMEYLNTIGLPFRYTFLFSTIVYLYINFLKDNRPDFRLVKYYNMEEVSAAGFFNFCKNNIILIIAVSFTLFFTYGIKLFWHNIGIDAEMFMNDKNSSLLWSVSIGRFGYSLLSKYLYIQAFNPFTSFFTTFCLIWFFTVSWCYIIAVFSKDTVKNYKLIPFALVFMTMPVWAETFYFIFLAAENALIIALCPYIIYLLYKGFLDSENSKTVSGFILLVFITSVYQAIVPMFCCGVFICFLLLQEKSDYEPKIYRNLCIKLFITLLISYITYSFIDKVIIPNVFGFEKSQYFDNMNQWGKRPVYENINAIIETCKIIFNNLILLPVVLFLIKIPFTARKKIPSGRRILYILAGIGIPLCIILLTLIGGNWTAIRALYALPLAFAFMLFFLIKHSNKNMAILVYCFALFTAAYQAQNTAQLFFSDQLRYNEDVRFANDLNRLIRQIQPENDLPVVLVGHHKTSEKFHANYIKGDVIGNSIFEWGDETIVRGLIFMKSLGFNYKLPNYEQIDTAFKEAIFMPSYPHPDCIKIIDDFIVIKISEIFYE